MANPYQFHTKGEMLRDCRDPTTLANVAARTVSCGKWKRKNKQCGRCVPCIIRRAAFYAAGIEDGTPYRFRKLAAAMSDEDERDDLLAMTLAVEKARTGPLAPWVALSGPLPTDRATRDGYVDVFRRGMDEIEAYLHSQGLV